MGREEGKKKKEIPRGQLGKRKFYCVKPVSPCGDGVVCFIV